MHKKKLTLPPAFFEKCSAPEDNYQTWKDVAIQVIKLKSALRKCSGQLDAVREWLLTTDGKN